MTIERQDFRHLPPVEPITPLPERYSQTLLAKEQACPRSSYLYAKYRGGGSSHPMDTGSAGHMVFERLMRDLVIRGEKAIAPEDPGQAASMTAAVVDEVLRDRPDLVVTAAEADGLRAAAYHWAIANDVDPETVAGIERLFVLELSSGLLVSGKIDLLSLPSPELAQIDDYKVTYALRSQDDYDSSFQPWMYAALVMYGRPVDADGELGEPLGEHLKGIAVRELYPRYLRDDGLMHMREMLLSRSAVADFRADLERQASRLAGRFESWDFPARAGSWCTQCPAPLECPLPEHLRDHAGTVNSAEQAAEAWEKAQLVKARVTAIEKEVKNFCRAHGIAIEVGDQRWEWTATEGRAVKKRGRSSDWDGLVDAIRESTEFGTPFDPDEWIKQTTGSSFSKSKITNGESR